MRRVSWIVLALVACLGLGGLALAQIGAGLRAGRALDSHSLGFALPDGSQPERPGEFILSGGVHASLTAGVLQMRGPRGRWFDAPAGRYHRRDGTLLTVGAAGKLSASEVFRPPALQGQVRSQARYLKAPAPAGRLERLAVPAVTPQSHVVTGPAGPAGRPQPVLVVPPQTGHSDLEVSSGADAPTQPHGEIYVVYTWGTSSFMPSTGLGHRTFKWDTTSLAVKGRWEVSTFPFGPGKPSQVLASGEIPVPPAEQQGVFQVDLTPVFQNSPTPQLVYVRVVPLNATGFQTGPGSNNVMVRLAQPLVLKPPPASAPKPVPAHLSISFKKFEPIGNYGAALPGSGPPELFDIVNTAAGSDITAKFPPCSTVTGSYGTKYVKDVNSNGIFTDGKISVDPAMTCTEGEGGLSQVGDWVAAAWQGLQDLVNLVANAYNSIEKAVVDVLTSLGLPSSLSNMIVQGMLVACGLPPSLPDVDKLESDGIDYIADTVEEQTGVSDIPGASKLTHDEIVSGIHAGIGAVQTAESGKSSPGVSFLPDASVIYHPAVVYLTVTYVPTKTEGAVHYGGCAHVTHLPQVALPTGAVSGGGDGAGPQLIGAPAPGTPGSAIPCPKNDGSGSGPPPQNSGPAAPPPTPPFSAVQNLMLTVSTPNRDVPCPSKASGYYTGATCEDAKPNLPLLSAPVHIPPLKPNETITIPVVLNFAGSFEDDFNTWNSSYLSYTQAQFQLGPAVGTGGDSASTSGALNTAW